MSEQRGTLEALIGELTRLLDPLTNLTPNTGHVLLRELGLPATAEQAATISSALQKVTSAITNLINLRVDLDIAIDGDDGIKVGAKAIAAIDQVAQLISSFDDLQSAIGGLGLPNAAAIVAKLPAAIFGHLLTLYVGRSPGVLPALELAGILERTDHNVASFDSRHTVLHV